MALDQRTLRRARRFRRQPTRTEDIAWRLLRDRRLDGVKFRRQVPIDSVVVDFACFEHRLVLELDGGIHILTQQRDADRDAKLAILRFRVLRLDSGLVLRPHDFINAVRRACGLSLILPAFPKIPQT